jgi:predicted enzyme related to lactoylglutathione lyase
MCQKPTAEGSSIHNEFLSQTKQAASPGGITVGRRRPYMEMHTHALSWAEIPVADFERAKKFYNALFAFEMPEMPMGSGKMGILLHDREHGGIGAAIVEAEGYEPSDKGSIVYLNGGQDLTMVLDRVEAAGGQIEQGKTEIPQMGYYAFFTDSEGNKVGLYSAT